MTAAVAPSLKSPEAFRTIGEVSTMLDMPQHVLRFWETRFPQIRPIKRAGGRRFYRPEDVNLLRGIRVLLYFEGYTIRGVQKILREKGVRHTAALGRDDAARPPANAEGAVAAFDALAALARAHDAAAETLALDGGRRTELEMLFGELRALKAEISAARKISRFPSEIP